MAYDVWLKTPNGKTIDHLTRWVVQGTAFRKVYGVGECELVLKPEWYTGQWITDNVVVIDRNGIQWAYLLRQKVISDKAVTLSGYCPKHLLTRRVVLAYEGETGALFTTTEADDAMKDVVTAMITDPTGDLAPDSGFTRVWHNFAIDPDLKKGAQITIDVSMQQVYTVNHGGALAAMADASREAGTAVWFDVVPTIGRSDISFTFKTYTGQPGNDVSKYVKFSDTGRTIKDAVLDISRVNEATVAIVEGQGEKTEQVIETVTATKRAKASPYNYIETAVRATGEDDDNLEAVGQAALAKRRIITKATGVLLDTAGQKFGVNWNHGDRVHITVQGFDLDPIITSTVWNWGSDGKDEVLGRFDND